MTGAGFHDDLKERVRDASDIVEVVGEHVALRPRGREYVGLCPFHDDHKPSMAVIPHKGIFHCHPCGTGGDVFAFVQKFHGMEFREALEFLAERAGIEVRRADPAQGGRGSDPAGAGGDAVAPVDRAGMRRATGFATDFYRSVLRHPEHGREVRRFIERRGIDAEMIERFRLGASPARSDGLLTAIRSKGHDVGPFVAADLLRRSDRDGSLYDAFRDRLMFPIMDATGRVVLGFGARRVDGESDRKYLNSSATELFDKRRVLYGLAQASPAIRRTGVAVVAEGYMDVIACHQRGIENVVGVLGVALTREHARLLSRLCGRIVLLFDADEAGLRAAGGATEVLFDQDVDVAIAILGDVTDAKDPDELLQREDGVRTLRQAIDGATDLLRFRLRGLEERTRGLGPGALHAVVTEELAALHALGLDRVAPSKRHLVLHALAGAIHDECGPGFEPRLLLSLLENVRRKASRRADAGGSGGGGVPSPSRGGGRRLTPAEHLLGCLLNDRTLWLALDARDRKLVLEGEVGDERARHAWEVIERLADSSGAPDLAAVLGELDAETASLAVSIARRVELETEGDRDRLHAHWAQILANIRRFAEHGVGSAEDPVARLARLREAAKGEGSDRAGKRPTPDRGLRNTVLPGVARPG